MDKVWSVYSYFFDDQFFDSEDQYLSIDQVSQNAIATTDDYQFMYVFRQSEKSLQHSRKVYTILDCLTDFGGLAIALAILLQPMLSCFTQAVKSSTILDDTINLDYDAESGSSYHQALSSPTGHQKKFPHDSHQEIK